jgi:hypothetical protein
MLINTVKRVSFACLYFSRNSQSVFDREFKKRVNNRPVVDKYTNLIKIKSQRSWDLTELPYTLHQIALWPHLNGSSNLRSVSQSAAGLRKAFKFVF